LLGYIISLLKRVFSESPLRSPYGLTRSLNIILSLILENIAGIDRGQIAVDLLAVTAQIKRIEKVPLVVYTLVYRLLQL